MKLAIIISSGNIEINWNALRLANLAIKKGDEVAIFLIGEGVEFHKTQHEKFDMKEQIEKFLQSKKAKITVCTTCMNLRNLKEHEICPLGNLEDLYQLIVISDKVLTF